MGILAEENSAAYLLDPASPEEFLSSIKSERCLGQAIPEDSEVPFSAEARDILKLGAEEADDHHEKEISNEHLLLGLLRQGNCYAAQLLLSRGVSLQTVRERLASIRKDPSLVARTNRRPFFPKGTTWQELGIPEGYAGPKLLYNPPSETMIVQVQGNDAETWLPTRLYIKHKDATQYTQVGDPDEWTSFDSPVTSLDEPLLGFNVTAWHGTGDAIGGDWKELNILNLKSGIIEYSVKNGELILPEKFNECWVDNLLAISDDGKQIYLAAGLSFLGENNSQSRVSHVLAVLDLTSKHLEPITTLQGTFL